MYDWRTDPEFWLQDGRDGRPGFWLDAAYQEAQNLRTEELERLITDYEEDAGPYEPGTRVAWYDVGGPPRERPAAWWRTWPLEGLVAAREGRRYWIALRDCGTFTGQVVEVDATVPDICMASLSAFTDESL